MHFLGLFIIVTYVSGLNDKLNVIAGAKFNSAFGFGKVEKYLFDHIGTFDKTKWFLHRTDDTTVFDWMNGILKTNMTGAQVTALIRCNLKTDFIARTQNDITFNIVFGVGQKEAFTTIFIANSSSGCLTGTAVLFYFSCYRSSDSLFRQNLRSCE